MQTQNNGNNTYRIRINSYIRVPQVRVILADGSTAGVMNTWEALKLAQEQGLDLVEINPKSAPPVCKIVDYGKFKYDEKKKQQAAKKSQKTSDLKEIDFRPVTEDNDMNHKLQNAKEFLAEGHKVKFVVKFRGREMAHKEIGKQKLDWMLEQIKDLISGSSMISLEGKDMSTVVSPKTSK